MFVVTICWRIFGDSKDAWCHSSDLRRTTTILILPVEQHRIYHTKPKPNHNRSYQTQPHTTKSLHKIVRVGGGRFTMLFHGRSLCCSLLFSTLFIASQINAWIVPKYHPTKSPFHSSPATRRITSPRFLVHHDSTILPTLTVVVVVESWRQYVPLVVSFAVITDILLGSPVANTVMAPLRPPSENDKTNNNNNSQKNPKERIDTQALANAAIERAKNTLELRRYLDENKTDWQKMEEIRKKMDQEITELDAKLDERRKELE